MIDFIVRYAPQITCSLLVIAIALSIGAEIRTDTRVRIMGTCIIVLIIALLFMR